MANDHVKMFTEEYAPIALQVSQQTGIAPSILLAQWGMESDYGRKPVGHFNFANIKDMSGAGNEATDNKTKSKDKYVNFESPEAFGDYYAHMMRRLYPKALNSGNNIEQYAEGLRSGEKGAYAEDKNYEEAIKNAHKLTSNFFSDPNVEQVKVNPFEGYESEAGKMKGEPITRTSSESQSSESAPIVGGVIGAGVNAIAPPFTNPQVAPRIDTSKAEEAHRVAQDKLDILRQQLEHYAPTGVDELENQFHQSRQELERLKNEQRLAQERLKQKAPQAPAPVVTEVPTIPEVTPRTKAGDAGAVNWVHSMSDEVPDVLANQALNMRSDNPRGGQAIIDANAQAIQKQSDLGLGDYGLTRTAGGVQLALPPTTVAERQAEIDKQTQEQNAELAKKAEENRIKQEEARMDEELTRAYHERELERLRQERAQQGARHNIIAEQRKITTPIVRQVNKAQSDAEVTRRRLERASQQPSGVTRPLDVVGAGSAKMGVVPRTIVGAGAGLAGVMSYQEALDRFKAGDTSEAVLKALEAGSAGAMLVPPATKGLQRIRGAGTIGAGTLGAFELGRRLLRDRPEE
jgi:hypothetical protein